MVDTKKLINEAKLCFQLQQYKRAHELFNQVLDQHPEGFADVFNYLGLIAHHEGNFGQAMDHFKQALKLNPHYTEAVLNLSILYNDLGRYDQAKKLVSKSQKEVKRHKTAIDPFIRSKLANKHAEIADWYHGVGAFKEAATEYAKALELEPNYADLRTKMAVCLREQGNLKGALDELKTAISKRERCTEAYVQLGVTHYAMGEKKQARAAWKSALKKFPSNETIKMYLKMAE